MASYSKIWCTFIPHMRLKAKFHDTIFIIKLCARRGGRGGAGIGVALQMRFSLKGQGCTTRMGSYIDIPLGFFIAAVTCQFVARTTPAELFPAEQRLHISQKRKENFLGFG